MDFDSLKNPIYIVPNVGPALDVLDVVRQKPFSVSIQQEGARPFLIAFANFEN